MDLHMRIETPTDFGVFLTSSPHLQFRRSLGHQAFPQIQSLSPQSTWA
jgi:hypothetical protein